MKRWPTEERSRLWTFVSKSPFARRPILAFLRQAAREILPGALVLDAGAGDAPYRALFGRCRYLTADFAATSYHDFGSTSVICDLAALPFRASALDAVVCSEVLEHVPDPGAVLAEFHRALRQGGALYLTTPLLWEVHEQPYDFYRYTPYALRRLLMTAGFADVSIAPRGGRYWSLGAALFQAGRLLPSLPGGLAGRVMRALLSRFLCLALAPAVGALDRFDQVRDATVGYCCRAIAQQQVVGG